MANYLIFSLLQSFHVLFQNVFRALFEGVFCRCNPLGLGSITLNFGWLYFSVVVSICCQKKFP